MSTSLGRDFNSIPEEAPAEAQVKRGIGRERVEAIKGRASPQRPVTDPPDSQAERKRAIETLEGVAAHYQSDTESWGQCPICRPHHFYKRRLSWGAML